MHIGFWRFQNSDNDTSSGCKNSQRNQKSPLPSTSKRVFKGFAVSRAPEGQCWVTGGGRLELWGGLDGWVFTMGGGGDEWWQQCAKLMVQGLTSNVRTVLEQFGEHPFGYSNTLF